MNIPKPLGYDDPGYEEDEEMSRKAKKDRDEYRAEEEDEYPFYGEY